MHHEHHMVLICDIVSPHLLEALAASEDPEARRLASKTLQHTFHVHDRRRKCLEDSCAAKLRRLPDVVSQSIVPDQLLKQVVDSGDADTRSKELAQKTLEIKQQAQERIIETVSIAPAQAAVPRPPRQIYDMRNLEQKVGKSDETYKLLPGELVRAEGQDAVGDAMANQAYDNCAKVVDFYQQVLSYSFLGGDKAIISSVHFEKDYQNASWLGDSIKQMVYGDGGGNLYNFTACLDIIGHEMTHAVIEHTCGLLYKGESGALNEHIADVFGMLITLWSDGKTTAQSDWLIGEGCLMPGVKGVAIRNMKFPGTAYDDPKFGKDPQPASVSDMEAYKSQHKLWATFDHGSVHAFSGVPNRAFVLAAETFGSNAWEKAGKIWWSTVSTHRIPPDCTFVQFADTTVTIARELFGEEASKVVRSSWDEVGIKERLAMEGLGEIVGGT